MTSGHGLGQVSYEAAAGPRGGGFPELLAYLVSEVIELLRTAADLAPSPAQSAMCLADGGDALVAKYRQFGTLVALYAAEDALREAIEVHAAVQPGTTQYFEKLGRALLERFRAKGSVEDGEESVDLLRAALEAATPRTAEHTEIRVDLAGALQARFERFGAVEDSDASIDLMKAALADIPEGRPEYALSMSNLAAALKGRFDRTKTAGDLEAAIEAAQDAEELLADDHPERAMVLHNLGAILYDRFDWYGTQSDLDTAIEAAQSAADAFSEDHPAYASCLSNLGNFLSTRFERIGASADLDEAIRVGHAAVEACPSDHTHRPICLINLAKSLVIRFERAGAGQDIDDAVQAATDAVEACPRDNPNLHVACLAILGRVLVVRSRKAKTEGDLERAVTVAQDALALCPEGHSAHSYQLHQLGDALHALFRQSGERVDIDDSVRMLRAALRTAPPGSLDRATRQVALGRALQSRYRSLGDERAAREAFDLLGRAARTQFATPSLRMEACRVAASLGGLWEPHESAALLEIAIGLLPELAGRHLERADQHHALGELVGLTWNAAALALSDPLWTKPGRAARALRLLEAGRAVLLSQALDTRSDLTDLQAEHPKLAQRYVELRDLLDSAPATSSADPAESSRRDRRALAAEFDALVERIRDEPGFASFNKPPTTRELIDLASAGPIVTVNVSPYRSDAILLTSSGISSIPLPDLDFKTLNARVPLFHAALIIVADLSFSSGDRQNAQATIRAILAWLWDTVAEPVLTALGFDTPCAADDGPRIWWAPGGLLGQLPLHAAGRPDIPGAAVLDRVVSSYTPTIRALRHARRQAAGAAADAGPARSLIVAMPTTPDLRTAAELPGAAQEALILADRLPEPTVLLEPGTDSPPEAHEAVPTRGAVLELLPHCAIAHFACHGRFDAGDPSRSRLLLHDHATAPLTIADLAPMRLERVELAYLSACETAVNSSDRLIDESVHLAAAFQLAGFPRVVGTLWEILDDTAAGVADDFYAALARPTDQALDPARSAHALHRAVRALRDKGANRNLPSLWAAYQHYGA